MIRKFLWIGLTLSIAIVDRARVAFGDAID